MKRAALLLALAGCAGRPSPVAEPTAIETNVMAMVSQQGFGHACPVNGKILTAAHNMNAYVGGQRIDRHFAWSNGNKRGRVYPYITYAHRDLTIVKVDGDQPSQNELSAEAPKIGDEVEWQEWDLVSNVFKLRRRKGRVTNGPYSGTFAFEPGATPGASGSCVFNEQGKVLGILVWGIGLNRQTTLALDVTGEWFPK